VQGSQSGHRERYDEPDRSGRKGFRGGEIGSSRTLCGGLGKLLEAGNQH